MRRGLPALALAVGLIGLAACGEDSDPAAPVGDPVAVREPVRGAEAAVLLPSGRLDLTVGEPVGSVSAQETKSLEEVEVPEGGSVVPVGWSFDLSAAPLGQALTSADVEPEVSLRIGDRSYPVGSPYLLSEGGRLAPSNEDGFFVPVATRADPTDIAVTVEYDGVTQTVVAAGGTRDLGRAAGLYELPAERPDGVPCPDRGWRTEPAAEVRVDCTISTVARTPYHPQVGWAAEGREWVLVDVDEVRLLEARVGGTGYRVEGLTDRSALGGAEPQQPLTRQDAPRDYAAGGLLVFDVERGATPALQLALDADLVAEEAGGSATGPDALTLRVSRAVPLQR